MRMHVDGVYHERMFQNLEAEKHTLRRKIISKRIT